MKIILSKTIRPFLMLALMLMMFIISLSSCKKFLNEPVDNRVSVSQIKDLEKAVITIEPGSDHHFTDLMSDDYAYKDIAGHVVKSISEKMSPVFTFAITKHSLNQSEMLSGGMNPNSAFLRYYYRINNANLLISQANKLKSQGGDITKINNVIAHALAIKAYCNFMLTNLFGKQYDKATAAKDLAVPYIGEYNTAAIVNRPRQTVAFMYDKIEEDMLNAIELMDEKNSFFSSKFYFSKRAIYGFLSRFYLYKKDWKKTIEYADLALKADRLPLNIKLLRANSKNNSDAYSRSYFNPANNAFLMMGNNTYQTFGYFWWGYYPYPFRQFLNNDTEFIQTNALFFDIIPVKFVYFFVKFYMNIPLITVDEVLFNKAEASIQEEGVFNASVKADLTAIINTLNFDTMVEEYLKTELNNIDNKNTGISFILKLKRCRFFAEGMRWFDLKRYQIPITHEYNGGTFTISGENPEEYVIKIPLEEIQFNKEI